MHTLPIASICVFIVGVATVLAQPGAKAQPLSKAVVAKIPFAFHVGSYCLPAGTYNVQLVGRDFLWIRGDSDSVVMVVVRASAGRTSAGSAVVFHRYGSQYFLREVRTAGYQEYLWASETRAERRAKLEQDASEPNSGPREDTKVEVALLAPPR